MTTSQPNPTAFSNEAGAFSSEVIDSIAGRIGVLDENDRFIAINRAWKERSIAMGMPPGYPLGLTLHDLVGTISPRYGRLLERGYFAVVEGRRNEFSCAYPVPARGQDDWFQQTFTRLAGDGPARCIVVIQSIQELKRAERRLRALNAHLSHARNNAEKASRAKSVFLAMMSHEMRTPLNGVLGMAQVMALGDLTDEQREHLDVIRRSGDALLSLVSDLLDLSQLESGSVQLEEGYVEVEQLAEYARSSCRTLTAAKDLSFQVRVETDASEPWLGDNRRVRQILDVLLSNAAKFTDQGDIDVRLDYRHNGLILRVRDTGVGIPAVKLEGIFESFVQADGSTTRRHEGSGLGLAICRNLVTLMGGKIEVESVEGSGATFTVTIPTSPSKPPPQAESESAEPTVRSVAAA